MNCDPSTYSEMLKIGAERFVTTEAKLANDYIGDHVAPHWLDLLSGHTTVEFVCHRWNVGEFQICDFSYGDCEVEIRLQPSEEKGVFLVVPLNGSVKVTSQRQCYSLRPGSAMTFSTQDVVNTCFQDSRNFRNLNIGTPYSALSQFLSSEFEAPVIHEITFTSQPIRIGPELNSLIEYIRWFSAQVDHQLGTTLRNSPPLCRHMYDLLLSMFISAVQNNYRALYYSRPAPGITPRYVKRAEDYMRAHACDPITVSDVAREVCVARRTLHMGFQRYRNYTVSEYLRNLRLSRVREELSTAKRRNLSVRDIAFSCGFVHLGRFSSAYRRRYGENPFETLRQGK